MDRFIIKSLLFIAVMVGSVILIQTSRPRSPVSADYMAAMIDKHNEIDMIRSPKIILGGGSNLAFGVNSRKLENAFGLPVINLGLHAGLGLTFILNELKYSIKKNDILFLSIEYFLAEGDYRLEANASGYFPIAHKFYSHNYITDLDYYLTDNREIFKKIFSMNYYPPVISPIKSSSIDVYSRKSFNSNGDVIGHLDKPNESKLLGRIIYPYKYWEGINKINEFYEYAKSVNVTVFFLFPDYPISEYNKNKTVFSKLELDIRNNLKVPILNSPTDFIYPDSCFFDTVYHLNESGREMRTDKMIKLIKTNTNTKLYFASK